MTSDRPAQDRRRLHSQERDEWKERFRAVSRAQSRYLYSLFVTSVFFWALRTGSVSLEQLEYRYTEVPVLGVTLAPRVILDCGPIVLGFLILALLGTFPALIYAKDRLELKSDDDFQRLDQSPTAIDFIFLARDGNSLMARWALLSYPAAILIAYFEAVWLFFDGAILSPAYPGSRVLAVVGAMALIAVLPRFATFANAKARAMTRK